jgi:hypothetical protein
MLLKDNIIVFEQVFEQFPFASGKHRNAAGIRAAAACVAQGGLPHRATSPYNTDRRTTAAQSKAHP